MKRFTTMVLMTFLASNVGAWTHNANFEGGTIGELAQGSNGFTTAFVNTKFTDVQVATGERASTVGVKQGNTAFGGWGGAVDFPSSLREGDELWYRVYIYFPKDFDYSAGGIGLKTMRIHTASSQGSNEGYIGFVISNKDNKIKPGSEVDKLDFNDGGFNQTVGTVVPKGTWQAYEQYVKFSATPGKAIYRIWQNGKLVFEDTTNNTLKSSTSKSNLVYVFSYWNDGAPKTQTAYVDDIVVTNQTPAQRDEHGNPMIGVTNAPTIYPPKPPVLRE